MIPKEGGDNEQTLCRLPTEDEIIEIINKLNIQ